MITRRSLVRSTLAFAAEWGVSRAVGEVNPVSRLRVLRGNPLAVIPADFTGLGYEESSVARVGLLGKSDATYVELVRNLGRGVLRAGGIVADFTSYAPEGEPLHVPKKTVVTRQSLEQLRGFLDSVDWRVIWSLNFGSGTLQEAIAEAGDVKRILRDRLLAIELGNEVENYGHGKTPLRPTTYSYADYRVEYTRWRLAILAAVPEVRFAAPDTAASVDWVERMAADARGDVQLLTTHYYRGDQRQGTREQLLGADPELQMKLDRLRRASLSSGIPWRMCEINSFFGGGRPGLSDTLAGALWTLDTMLLLARNGCAGVNIETGFNQLGFLSSYSPIRDDEAGEVSVGAPYYGMLAFAQATREAPEVLPTALGTGNVEVTAYVLGKAGRPLVVVLINKTADRIFHASLAPLGMRAGSLMRLSGSSIDSGEGMTLGGAPVAPGGHWTARSEDFVGSDVSVQASSAMIVRSREVSDRKLSKSAS